MLGRCMFLLKCSLFRGQLFVPFRGEVPLTGIPPFKTSGSLGIPQPYGPQHQRILVTFSGRLDFPPRFSRKLQSRQNCKTKMIYWLGKFIPNWRCRSTGNIAKMVTIRLSMLLEARFLLMLASSVETQMISDDNGTLASRCIYMCV